MPRLNLTLTADTLEALEGHAKQRHLTLAAAARELLGEAIARLRAREHRRRLVADYAAGRADAGRLLRTLERGQLDLLDSEDA